MLNCITNTNSYHYTHDMRIIVVQIKGEKLCTKENDNFFIIMHTI